ncbi:MAG: Retaining alpha-galactosidase, partial [Prevotella sp.]|nr:Retaining alpha-galactosidase [Prevotella sp.]
MKKNYFALLSLLCISVCCSLMVTAQKQFTLKAPDGKLKAIINVDKAIDYSISHNGDLMLDKSVISMALNDGS